MDRIHQRGDRRRWLGDGEDGLDYLADEGDVGVAGVPDGGPDVVAYGDRYPGLCA